MTGRKNDLLFRVPLIESQTASCRAAAMVENALPAFESKPLAPDIRSELGHRFRDNGKQARSATAANLPIIQGLGLVRSYLSGTGRRNSGVSADPEWRPVGHADRGGNCRRASQCDTPCHGQRSQSVDRGSGRTEYLGMTHTSARLMLKGNRSPYQASRGTYDPYDGSM